MATALAPDAANAQTQWVLRTPAGNLKARCGHSMAYDLIRDRVVLFGGRSSQGYQNDTWEWDGNTWVWRRHVTIPPARSGHAMAYDAARQRVVLFGGYSLSVWMNDTWEWDGTNWTQAYPGVSPSPRVDVAMVYDARRHRMVAFGGHTVSHMSNETWEYAGTTLVATGTPRPGQTVNLTLTAIGEAGRAYLVGSSLGAGPTPIDHRALGLGVDGLLFASVSGVWPMVFQGYRGLIGPNGLGRRGHLDSAGARAGGHGHPLGVPRAAARGALRHPVHFEHRVVPDRTVVEGLRGERGGVRAGVRPVSTSVSVSGSLSLSLFCAVSASRRRLRFCSSALSALRAFAQKVALLHQNAKAKGRAFAQSRKSEEGEEEEGGAARPPLLPMQTRTTRTRTRT